MKRAALLVLACAALTVGSCISFERQTMVFRYDPAKDRLLIFQIYEGIHGKDSGRSLDKTERAEIASVLERQRTFFFSNWILEYDRSAIEDLSRGSAGSQGRVDEALQRLAKMLLANAEVRNGRFFLNAEGKLSGYQFVTLENASSVVAQANLAISSAIAKGFVEEKDRPGLSVQSQRRIQAAAREGHEWIRLDADAIRLRYPLTYEDFRAVRRGAVDALQKVLATEESREAKLAEVVEQLSLILQSDLWITYVDGMVDIGIGRPGRSRAELVLNTSESEYSPNVVQFAKTHGGLEESPDLAGLMTGFFGSR